MSESPSKPVLAYWNIRGLAQPIRLLLNYVGEDFEDRQYEVEDAPSYSREAWTKVKLNFNLDYPNLPYYIDGDVRLTQSNTILRYIARKHQLDGSSENEKILVDLMAEETMDFRNGLVRLCYNPKFTDLKEEYLKNLKIKLKTFDEYLEKRNQPWFAGNNLTFVDFIMYELLDQHKVLEPTCLDATPRLVAFTKKFEDLKPIKKYMASDSFMKRPLNNKMAQFK